MNSVDLLSFGHFLVFCFKTPLVEYNLEPIFSVFQKKRKKGSIKWKENNGRKIREEKNDKIIREGK